MRATPLGVFGWLSLADHYGRLRRFVWRAWTSRELTGLPPVENQVCGFASEGTGKDLIASINSLNNRLIRAGVLKVP